MAELRCAFVGCGGVARDYLEVYRKVPGARVVSCVDIDLQRALQAAALFDGGAGAEGKSPAVRASCNFADALRPDVDLLVISTPNHLHCEQAVAALRLDKHVFLQKPLAPTLADGVAILNASRESRGRSGIYMSYFDRPAVHDFQEMARKGWFGAITQLHGRLMHPGGLQWSREAAGGKRSWRGSVELTGGGAFIQLAVHYIRMMCWIADDSITRVTGFASNLQCLELEGEDTVVALLEFASGRLATLNLSWCAEGEELSIHGTEGGLTYLDNRLARVRSVHRFSGRVVRYTGPDTESLDLHAGNAQKWELECNQHRMFLEAVLTGSEELVSLQAATRDLAVVEAFYDSVRTGKAVNVAQVAEMSRV